MESKIWEVIEDFCGAFESFTSLDISNAVKQGGFPGARHRDIAPVVRQIFADRELDQFGYVRTLIDVELLNGLKTKTNLYHHVSVSPDDYTDRKQVALVPKQDDVVVAPTTFSFNDDDRVLIPPPVDGTFDAKDIDSAIDSIQDEDDDEGEIGFSEDEIECYCKTDGRLEIPVEWVRKMGWLPGYTVCFIFRNDKIIASTEFDDDDTVVGKITVSADNRVRIPKMAFMRAGFDYSPRSTHLITTNNDNFEIDDSDV